MATYTFDYAVKANGKIIPARTPVEINEEIKEAAPKKPIVPKNAIKSAKKKASVDKAADKTADKASK